MNRMGLVLLPSKKNPRKKRWIRMGEPPRKNAGNVNFNKWFEGSKVVDAKGKPLRVFHGTTHDFSIFKAHKGYVENDMGVAHYFTSSKEDVNYNYSRLEGPDLNNRIEFRAEQLNSNEDIDMDTAKRLARKELTEHEGVVMPVYLKITNPLIVSKKGGTYFEYTFNEETEEDEGTLNDLYEAFLDTASEYDIDGPESWQKLNDDGSWVDGVNAWDVIAKMKETDPITYVEDENGNLAVGQFVEDVFKKLGFDGIIVKDVNLRYSNMPHIDSSTVYYLAFDSTQVKSAIGNSGAYNPDDPDITKCVITIKPKQKFL